MAKIMVISAPINDDKTGRIVFFRSYRHVMMSIMTMRMSKPNAITGPITKIMIGHLTRHPCEPQLAPCNDRIRVATLPR